jgi:activator of HSP90 ATPase
MGGAMKTRTIRQSVTLRTSPHEVYEALMDSVKHSEFTGDVAEISRDVGGGISAGSGYIEGRNLELVTDRKIVQAWRGSDWPEGHYSRATFSLAAAARGTRLSFRQSGVPEEFYEDISQGWRDYYWTPMKATYGW